MIRTRGGLAALAITIATTLLAGPREALAETGATLVAIVTAEPSAALTRRVKAQLEGIGLDVLVIKPPDEASTSRAPLEQAARGVGAAAAIRLVSSSGGRVEVWVADRVTGKTVVRELDANAEPSSDTTVAVGAVELLRASLMELHSSEAPKGEVKATEKIAAIALPSRREPPSPPRLTLAIHVGAELGVRHLGPSPEARLALSLRVHDRLFVRALGDVSLAAAHTTTRDGRVETRAAWLGASFVAQLTPPEATWAPELSLGLAAAHVGETGVAKAPFVGTSAGAWAAMPFLGAGLGVAVVRGIRLRADAVVGWAAPSLHVRTPSGEAGRWGAPLVAIAPGIELLWAP